MFSYTTAIVIALLDTEVQADPPPDSKNVLTEYQAYLDSLPKEKPVSVSQAIGKYLAIIAPLDVGTRTDACIRFIDFYDEVRRTIERWGFRQFWKLYDEDKWDEAWEYGDHSAETLELQRHGLTTQGDEEGGLEVITIPGYIPAIFGAHVSDEVRVFIQLRDKELDEGYAGDGELYITFSRLAERLGEWEGYLARYPASPFTKQATQLRGVYLLDLLTGLPNTSVEFDGNTPDWDTRPLYRQFIQEHPNTLSADILAEYCRRMGAVNWEKDPIMWNYRDEIWERLNRAHSLDIWPSMQLDIRVREHKH